MPRNQGVQCLIFILDENGLEDGDEHTRDTRSRTLRSSSSSATPFAKAFALLPSAFLAAHPSVMELFHKNNIHILNEDNVLRVCVKNDKLTILEIFLDETPSVDPLFVIASRSYHNVIKLLFPNVTLSAGDPPITMRPLVDDANVATLKRLMTYMPDIEIKIMHECVYAGKVTSCSLLQLAVSRNQVDLVRLLLQLGANVDDNKFLHFTPLHFASQMGLIESLRLLASWGANVNALDKTGCTPLHHARNQETAEILLQNGANVHCVAVHSGQNITPLFFAIAHERFEVVKVLLKYDAKIKPNRENDISCLYVTFGLDRSFLFKYFLEWHCLDYNYIKEMTVATFSLIQCPERLTRHSEDVLSRFSRILGRHVVKVTVLSWYLKAEATDRDALLARVNEMVENAVEYIGDVTRFVIKCEREIELLQSHKVGRTGLSLGDILKRDLRGVACLLKNKSVARFADVGKWQKRFPVYGRIMKYHFEKGKHRQVIMKEGLKSCRFLFKSFRKLPDEIAEEIVGYLSMQDAMVLKTVCAPLETRASRSRC